MKCQEIGGFCVVYAPRIDEIGLPADALQRQPSGT